MSEQSTPLSSSLPRPPSQQTKYPPSATEISSQEREKHIKFMREALSTAEQALSNSETPVACIFVHYPTARILARAHNLTNKSFNGTRHAEFIGINHILTSSLPIPIPIPRPGPDQSPDINPNSENENGREEGGRKYDVGIFKECDLYVTVEPCIMCASLLRQLGIRRAFFGAGNEKFGGNGGVLNIQRGNGRFDSLDSESKSELENCEEGGGEGNGDVDRGNGGDGEGKGKGEGEGRERERKEGDYEVSGGWLREEAIVLLRRFYVQENGRAPEEKRGKEGRILRLDVDGVEFIG